jgi:CRISPR-associated protein Csm5
MRVRLSTLTPFHIGGREGALNPLEFVVFEGRCYVISETKLARALQECDQIDTFYTWFTGRDRPALREFLHERDLLNARFLEHIAAYTSPCSIRISQDLRTFVRDAFNRPFLPGTSIKGAIRTAFLYKLLKELPPERRKTLLEDFVVARLQEYRQDPRGQRRLRWFQERFKQWFAQRFEADIFQKFILREGQRRYDPHTDLLRCLRLTDSTPVEPQSARVEEIKVFSARSSESPKRWSLYAECIPAGQTFECEVTLDEMLLGTFADMNPQPWLGVDFTALRDWLHNPLEVWAEMGHDLCEREGLFFLRELRLTGALPERDSRPFVRLGWGAGLQGASVDMLLPPPLIQELRNTLFAERSQSPAPKSRRLVVQSRDHAISLGWLQIAEV